MPSKSIIVIHSNHRSTRGPEDEARLNTSFGQALIPIAPPMGFEEVPYCELPLRNDSWRISHVGPQNIDDEHSRHGAQCTSSRSCDTVIFAECCEYSGRDYHVKPFHPPSQAQDSQVDVFFFVSGSQVCVAARGYRVTLGVQVRLVETGCNSTGRCMQLCFGGNILPGARLFSYGDVLMFVCATVIRGCIFRVVFHKQVGTLSFFDEQSHPETEQLDFKAPDQPDGMAGRAVAFGCEVIETRSPSLPLNHPGRLHLCTAIAVPGGKCWRVEPGKPEPHEITGIHGVVGRIMTPVKNLWANRGAYEFCALHLIGLPSISESEIEWSIIGTCSDRNLRMWSRGQCHEVCASGPNSVDFDSLELVTPRCASEYNTCEDFPRTGQAHKVYLAKDTNKMHTWSGFQYISQQVNRKAAALL